MTILADLSRFDADEDAARYDGVILNAEDPRVRNKAAIATAAGKPVFLYSWVYPGGGHSAVDRAVALADSLGNVKGIWLDYEQDGVRPQDILDAHAADAKGHHVGVYAYEAMMNAQGQGLTDAIGNWPLWMAYYPGANDGHYDPSYSDEARARGAVMHQWTSSNGTRDLNIVLDDNWYASLTGQGTGEEEMTAEEWGKLGTWMQQSEARTEKYVHDLLGKWLPEMEARLGAKIDALKK